MKRFLTIALAASFGLVAAGTAFAAPSTTYGVSAAANGIAGSRHNLGAFSNHVGTQGTTEICVFCHTPHHTNTSVNPAPLWNRTNRDAVTGATVTYQAYGTTLGGSNITAINSVSQACLSCHDGVTALDNLVNAPGKSGVVAAGTTQGWTFFDPLNEPWVEGNPYAWGPGNTMQWSARVRIGTNLSDDHPMSVVYQSDRASLRPKTVVLNNIDLTSGMAASAASFDANNLTRNYWAVKGYISNTATIKDLLKGNSETVECSSCHDPHFANATGASANQGFVVARTTPDGLFLRRVGGNVASAVCRTCHNK